MLDAPVFGVGIRSSAPNQKRPDPRPCAALLLLRIAYDIEELARSRRVTDLSGRENDADPRLRLRRRMAEPPIEISRGGTSIRQSRQAWEDYESRLRRAGLPILPNPYRHLDRSEN